MEAVGSSDGKKQQRLCLGLRSLNLRGLFLAVTAVLLVAFGGAAAHALWNQSAIGTITVGTGAINAIGTNCTASRDSATVTWPSTGTAANATSYSYTVTVGDNTTAGTGTSVTISDGSLGLTLSGDQTYLVEATAHYGGTWQSSTTRTVQYDSGLAGLGATYICL